MGETTLSNYYSSIYSVLDMSTASMTGTQFNPTVPDMGVARASQREGSSLERAISALNAQESETEALESYSQKRDEKDAQQLARVFEEFEEEDGADDSVDSTSGLIDESTASMRSDIAEYQTLFGENVMNLDSSPRKRSPDDSVGHTVFLRRSPRDHKRGKSSTEFRSDESDEA